MGRGYTRSIVDDWVLELGHCVAKSEFSFLHHRLRQLMIAIDTMAVFPVMGITRRNGSTGEHDPMRSEQLLHPRVLAIMASIIQSLGRPIYLHPRRRIQKRRNKHTPRFHLCGIMARSEFQIIGLGLVGVFVHFTGNHCSPNLLVRKGIFFFHGEGERPTTDCSMDTNGIIGIYRPLAVC